jgi:hypothetical protein
MSRDHQHAACVGEPVSWLDLELYALGELPDPAEERAVEQHLAGCEACQGCLETIQTDRRELPALPAVEPAPEHERESRPWWRWLQWSLAPAMAVTAAVLLVVLLPVDPALDLPARRVAIKGGDLALTLVRRRGDATTDAPGTFGPGDRFKVEVTCPPGQALSWDVVVFQGGEAAFPFAAPAGPLPCGNREPVAGAFGLTGDKPAHVCLVVGAGLTRARLSLGPDRLPPSAACLSLRPMRQ